MKIYALLDKNTETYSQYMFLEDERALKATYIKFFREQPNSILEIYASEYDLMEIATIENEVVTPGIKQVCNLSALLSEDTNGKTNRS